MIDVDIPEVTAHTLAARFFKENGKDYVEISQLGATDTLVKKVTPELMAQFRDQWNAYCDGKPLERRAGTPLTHFPEVSKERDEEFVRRNLHTVEELAQLNDHQCQALGHGLIALRKKAQVYVMQQRAAEQTRSHKRILDETAKAVPAPEESKEIDDLKAVVAEQGKKIDALLEAITALVPKKRGKKPNGDKLSPTDSDKGV